MKRAMIVVLVWLAGCVQAQTLVASRDILVADTVMAVRQEANVPIYGLMASATGDYSGGVVGKGRAVVVQGALDRDMAILAMGQFCGIAVDPAKWDGDYVHHFADTNEYQFSELCQ